MTDSVGFRSERGPILIALMLSTALVAIDGTIIATAVPTVVRDIGGESAFPWLFSVYVLVQAVTVPVYSKLADTFGRKPIMIVGIGLFLLGSVLCGAAWSMPTLIIFRIVQGLGAGAVMPMSITIAGDIYTIQERAKAQGYIASVWGIASVVGPTLGGVFSEFVSWRWIFYVNVPICILAAIMIIRTLHETIDKKKHRVDYLGAALITAGTSLLILAVLEGGVAWAWNSGYSIAAFVGGGLLVLAFLFVESRAAEPILPLWVFSRRLLASTSLVSLGVGAIVIGLSAYVPTYLEGSLNAPPIVAGLALAALTLGWPLSASQAGRLYLRIGFRNTALIGLAFATIGSVALAASAHSPSVAVVAITCFIIGLGMGLIAVPTLISAQSSVGWEQRGVVTGANLFARSIGSAVGVAIFGAIANSLLLASANSASSSAASNGVAPASGTSTASVSAVVTSSTAVFVAVVVTVLATIAAALAMPRSRVELPGAVVPVASSSSAVPSAPTPVAE